MSLSNYALNERINYLQYEIDNLAPPAGGYVPINGNTTINNIKTFTTLPQSSVVPLNNNDLVNKLYVDNAVSTPTLSQVLLSNNSAGSTSINMNTNAISAISTATAKTSLIVDNSVVGANATLTQSNLTINATGLSGLPSLTLNQSGVGVGNLTEEFYNQRTAQTGEFNRMSFYGKNSAGTKTEYARFHQNAPVITSGSVRGRLDFGVQTGSGITDYLILNGQTGQVGLGATLDCNSNNIQECNNITTSNLNKYGVNSVNFYNTSNASIPPNTPDNNYKLTMINEGVPDVITALPASLPSTWGNITASIQNFNGLTYVGTNQGNIYYSNDGITWNDAGFSLDGQINAMVEFNSELIIGGTFTKEVSSGVFSYYICRMSSSNVFIPYLWANYPNLTGGFNYFVRCLFSNGGYLYVGGDFTNEINGGLSCPYIAIVDTGNNLYCVDNSSGTGYGFNAPVNFIIVNANAPNRFVIGGEFSSMIINSGTFTTTYSAVWQTNDYNTIVNPYEVIPLNNYTLCATTNGGSVYIGGYFTGNTTGDYLMNIEWDNVSSYVLVANPYGASPLSPINNILQNAGIFWTTLSGELYEANLLIGTSPFGGAYWEIIIPTVWGQTLFSTNSASQNPVIAYYLFTNNLITLTMAGGYLIQNSTSSYSNGIILYAIGSVCEMIFNATNNTFYITTLLNATPF